MTDGDLMLAERQLQFPMTSGIDPQLSFGFSTRISAVQREEPAASDGGTHGESHQADVRFGWPTASKLQGLRGLQAAHDATCLPTIEFTTPGWPR